MHLMFNDAPEYTGAEGGDIMVGAMGERYSATTEFDGWGYVQLDDARDPNLRIIDSYAVPEALDEEFAQGHRLGKGQGAPLLLFSDRDEGLYILRYDEDRRDRDDDDDDRRGGRDDDD